MASQSWKDFSSDSIHTFVLPFFFFPGSHIAVSYELWFAVWEWHMVPPFKEFHKHITWSFMFSRNSRNKRDAKMLVGNRGSVTGSFLSVYYQHCAVNSSQGQNRGRAIETQNKWKGLPSQLEGGWVSKWIPIGVSPSMLTFMLCHDSLMLIVLLLLWQLLFYTLLSHKERCT